MEAVWTIRAVLAAHLRSEALLRQGMLSMGTSAHVWLGK